VERVVLTKPYRSVLEEREYGPGLPASVSFSLFAAGVAVAGRASSSGIVGFLFEIVDMGYPISDLCAELGGFGRKW